MAFRISDNVMKEKSNDTKTAIKREFIREYAKRKYDRITIKELCAETPVARTTFYSYYDNIDSVLAEMEDEIISGLKDVAKDLSEGDIQGMDFTEFFDRTMEYVKSRWSEIYALLIIQPDLRFIYKWKNAIKLHFRLRHPSKVSISNYDLISEVVASGVIGAYRYWMQNPDRVDSEALNKVTTTALAAVADIL